MENNEIMMNEMEDAIVETTDGIVTENAGKGLKKLAIAGAAVVVGVVIYKKLIKPAIAKAKAKKESENTVAVDFEEVEPNCEEVDS